MMGKNNHYLRDTKDGTKVESYSIKKFKVGTASVVIRATIFFGAGAVAQASEEVSNNTTADNTTNAAITGNTFTNFIIISLKLQLSCNFITNFTVMIYVLYIVTVF